MIPRDQQSLRNIDPEPKERDILNQKKCVPIVPGARAPNHSAGVELHILLR